MIIMFAAQGDIVRKHGYSKKILIQKNMDSAQ
jgi:hypothetical protein